jgi:hypothetical protein
MDKREILLNVITHLKSNLNVKALDFVIEEYGYLGDLNELLFLYYTRSRMGRRFEHPSFQVYTFDKNDIEDMKEFEEFKKDVGIKNYKQDYDYTKEGGIRQKNTYCICEVMNGYRNHYHYGLDVYQWLEANNIKEAL